jgi:chemotaxis protein CheD
VILQMGSAIDLFIHPGEHEFADENFRLRTTLGSCVSIIFWHPERRLGGMCHYMLPSRKRAGQEAPNAKYADEALSLMLQEARKLGTRPEQYQVKVFGGGNMFPGYQANKLSVAARNVRAARKLLADHGLVSRSECLGGAGYRNVIFDIASGDVWVRHTNVASTKRPARSL